MSGSTDREQPASGRSDRIVPAPGAVNRVIQFSLEQPLLVIVATMMLVGFGIASAPFDWQTALPRNPVAVDAIPDLGENQQIVFTEWPGRSPQDVEDQVTYPLTVSLMGLPGVNEVRSTSMFGFSSIYVIFEDDVDFYWSRSRIVEKLNALAPGTLPDDASPALGPDATALGQVYWYTIEGRDPDGRPVGGWDLHELRSVQDWHVRYGLLAAEGVSEVASAGGFVREYHVDVDPDAMRAYGVSLDDVMTAVQRSNLDVGARTTEINRVEYVIRGIGLVKELADIEDAVLEAREGFVPVRVSDVAHVSLGPAERRGALDKGGAEAVGGVVVVRQGFNPLQAINNLKATIDEIAPGMPVRPVVDWTAVGLSTVEHFGWENGFDALDGPALNEDAWMNWMRSTDRAEWPSWVTTSRLTIVPFYDRTELIHETLGTLNDALIQQILITIVVVLLMLMHMRSALIISSMLPLAVLMTFITMKVAGVDANVVALAGIAIAIGTIVDMGIIVTENVMKHLDADLKRAPEERRSSIQIVYDGSAEVGSAVLTAIATTVVSFLPVFAMTGAEGKLFTPLAFTKTFVLIASVVIALTLVPLVIHFVIVRGFDRSTSQRVRGRFRAAVNLSLLVVGVAIAATAIVLALPAAIVGGIVTALAGAFRLFEERLPERMTRMKARLGILAAAVFVTAVLSDTWVPLGMERSFIVNFLFVAVLVGGLLGIFHLFERRYARILRWTLDNKRRFLAIPIILVLFGTATWLGAERLLGFVPATAERVGIGSDQVRTSAPWRWAVHTFPGLGREFMPTLDEGTFLWMPTTMPHASIGEALEVMAFQNMAFSAIPEVESVVGKIGRAETALDPAPVSMIETIINYKSEYVSDVSGRVGRFRYDRVSGMFDRGADGELIPDRRGRPYRQWRPHIRTPDDIWEEIVQAGRMPGTTSAPKLQPIETRQVMLQTGMRAPMGIKVRGPDLETIDAFALDVERLVRGVPAVAAATVNAERVVGTPYFEIEIDRQAAARHGLSVVDVQSVIMTAIGGTTATTTVEGRERYNVRVRYPRELRNDLDVIRRTQLTTGNGATVPLGEVAGVSFARGPQMIRSENTFPVSYVTFGGAPGLAEVEVVEQVREYLEEATRDGRLVLPAGVSYAFAGSYQNQLHAAATLRVVLPIALLLIFLILYLQFRSVALSTIIFSGIAVAWAGGFTMMWFFGQEWFLNFSFFGENLRALFQLHDVNLSVAVWVGFLALFGIATDDGVVIGTYLRQSFAGRRSEDVNDIRLATVEAGSRRVRPLLMTSATTILALLPVLTSTGRGAELMIPMAIPTVGGMALVLLTMFTVPVLYCWIEERRLRGKIDDGPTDD